MPPTPKSLTKGRWRAIALSILLHSAIVAAAVYGWFTWKHRPPPVETLAIEANVVDERALKGIASAPKPEPEPEPPPPEPVAEPEPVPVEEQGPPKPDPAELERKEAEKLAEEKIEKEKLEQEKADQQKEELKERENAERLEAEKQVAAKAAAEKAAQEKAHREKELADKRAAEKRIEDAAAVKKAAEEKVRLAREAELRRSLEAEERGNAARNSDDAARWRAQIAAKIQRAWKTPPSAQAGVECNVSVTQVMNGEVTEARVIDCNVDDAALRESLKDAVYRASPLPPPPVGVPFERILELTFKPQ